jgi:hypothetical protein
VTHVTATSPENIIKDLAIAHVLARCLHVVADFGVADALGEAALPAAELARRVGLDPDALARILRLLAAYGVFAPGPKGYSHTPASRLLTSADPHSLRGLVRMRGLPAIWRGFTELEQAARTGRPTTDWPALVAYFASHPEEAAVFNEAMVAKSQVVIPALLDAFAFDAFKVIADIGGGRGHLLQAILARVPGARGVLFELPHVIADAAPAASSRLRLVAGDFFADAMPAADLYILMDLLHDWPDQDAARILGALRRAAPRAAHVLIVETLVAETPGPHFSKTLDILMLALTGGRERTPTEHARLLESAGFELERVLPTAAQYSIVEAVAR